MRTSPLRHGLRVTVRLHGAVVSQEVRWPWQGAAFTLGDGDYDSVPTESGGPLLSGRWAGPNAVHLSALEPGVDGGALQVGDVWEWRGPGGAELALDLVPLDRARRLPTHAGMDVSLAVMFMALLVGVVQTRILLGRFFPFFESPAETSFEPTPEFIARLLERQFEGAETGALSEVATRPDAPNQQRALYMPAGSDGPRQRVGGGKTLASQPHRAPEVPDAAPSAHARATPSAPIDVLTGAPAPPPVVDPATPTRAPALLGVAAEPDLGETADSPLDRFIGWGFQDWYDVADARDPAARKIVNQLQLAHDLLAIDPESPAALGVVGYYAYLANNHALSEASYARYVELYPDDPSGYNNLALAHKRRGDYQTEESLYRRALQLDGADTIVMNNLAVNLAHQGRFDEALHLMERLESLTPGDPYAELHRSKIYAAMGRRDRALRSLRRAVDGVAGLGTMHHIEFRQDIRVDPAFDELRRSARFRRILVRAYGDDASPLWEDTHG